MKIMDNLPQKPLGRKAYGSIPHLPNSRLGPGEHTIPDGQVRIFTERLKEKDDRIYVQEKLDGSCVAVAKVNGQILALGRAGYLAQTSKFELHQLFAHWVRENTQRFDTFLAEGERAVGEWLAQAHGTRYNLRHEPFVLFDIMRDACRATMDELASRTFNGQFIRPHQIFCKPTTTEEAMEALASGGFHGALDPVEGAVWRHERGDRVLNLAKFVRADKVDGRYLPEVSGKEAVWNWRP